MSGVAYFEIQSDNPESAIHFYGDIFGWQFVKADGLPIAYWRIETGAIRGGLLKRPVPAPPSGCGTNAYVCSMEVEHFDSVAAEIIQRGGRVAQEKFAVPGVCWQGYFIDPDGNTFGLFQPDPEAK